MASSSNLTHNITVTSHDQHIEHHNLTLPLTLEEIAELLPHPNLAEQFKEMQERLLVLKDSNRYLREKLQAKKDILWSVVLILDEEPSHRYGKEPWSRSCRLKILGSTPRIGTRWMKKAQTWKGTKPIRNRYLIGTNPQPRQAGYRP